MKDWQVDPLSGTLLHVDLLRIAMDVRMRVRVPVHTFGEPQGVKIAGRHFRNGHARSGNRVLAGRHSGRIQGGRQRHDDRQAAARRRSCRSIREKMKLVTDPAARDRARRDAEEGRRAGAEAAVAAETAPAEPEVIKKGKKEEEGEEGAARKRSEGREAGEEGQGEVDEIPVANARAQGCAGRRRMRRL